MKVVSDAIKAVVKHVPVKSKKPAAEPAPTQGESKVKTVSKKEKKQTKEEKGKIKAERNVEEVMEDLETGI